MSEEQVKCQLCGEPMPEGEEMFNYHGLSGPCPKPPLPEPAPVAAQVDERTVREWYRNWLNGILALTPSDALAALEAVKREAREQALDEIAAMINRSPDHEWKLLTQADWVDAINAIRAQGGSR